MARALDARHTRGQHSKIWDEAYVGALVIGAGVGVLGGLVAAALWFARLAFWVSLTD